MKKAIDKLAYLLSDSKHPSVWASFLSIVLSLLCSSILLLALGSNPITAFKSFLQGSGFLPKASYGGGSGMLADLFTFLNYLAPMILSALSYIVGAQAGLFNIGISGQMLAAGFCATALVGYADLNPVVAKLLVVIVGMVVGGLLGAFIGFLKYKFNISEVVSTIMVNYIINYLTGFAINNYYKNTVTRSMNAVSTEARLTLMDIDIGGVSCDVPLGIILAIIAAVIVKFIMDKTVFGLELKGVGMNRDCAEYTGIKVGNRLVAAMAISGMLAGIAGVTYYCGYVNTIYPKTLPAMGYDAITVALLGNNNAIGSIFAAVLVSIFQVGADYMSSQLGVVKEIASLITGILLLFSACVSYFRYLASRRLRRNEDEAARQAKLAEAAAGEDGATSEVMLNVSESEVSETPEVLAADAPEEAPPSGEASAGSDSGYNDEDAASGDQTPPVEDAGKEDEPNA